MKTKEDYERAAERAERSFENLKAVKAEADRMIEEAEYEYADACTDLATYEDRPGIPKEEYR